LLRAKLKETKAKMKGFAIRGLVVAAAIALAWFGFDYQLSGQFPEQFPEQFSGQFPGQVSRQNVAGPAPGETTIALTGARVIDGTGTPPIDDAILLIEDGRIAGIGPTGSVAIPDGATIIDMSGKTIMPGLINAHGHVTVDDNTQLPVREHMEQRLQIYADYGVTTVVSLGSHDQPDELEGVKIRDEQRAGTLIGARFFTGGRNARGETEEEARASVAHLDDIGVDIIKYHINGRPNDMTPPVYGALVDEARARGLLTAVHIFNLVDAKGAIESGTNVIAHSVRDRDVDEELINEMIRLNVGYVPTLTRDLSVFIYENEPDFFDDPFFLRGADVYATELALLRDAAHQEEIRNDPGAQEIKIALDQAMRNLKILSDGGVTIAMGSDSGSSNDWGRWQGYFEHVEMEMMVEAGMSEMQVLLAATGNAARIMNLDEIGTIERGKWADLLVLSADPLSDIRNTREIDSVWIAGNRRAMAR
jgi:imidazolonepropionase-like amidohydrolase